VPLFSALDRVLAQDVISPINVPAYDNSAMDGALRGADLPGRTGTATFKVIGIAYAAIRCTGSAGRRMHPHHDGGRHAGRLRHVLPQELASAIGDDSVTIAHGVIRAPIAASRAKT
jgi:molybdopterin molybdotransferase